MNKDLNIYIYENIMVKICSKYKNNEKNNYDKYFSYF